MYLTSPGLDKGIEHPHVRVVFLGVPVATPSRRMARNLARNLARHCHQHYVGTRRSYSLNHAWARRPTPTERRLTSKDDRATTSKDDRATTTTTTTTTTSERRANDGARTTMKSNRYQVKLQCFSRPLGTWLSVEYADRVVIVTHPPYIILHT